MQTNNSLQTFCKTIKSLEDAFGITLEKEKEKALLTYFSTLDQWNRSINLTGIKDRELSVYKHLGDSLIFSLFIPEGTKSLLDIGTGPGVPGLLLKILRPELQVVLAEAVKKKCSFLRYVSSLLRLSGLFVHEGKLCPETTLKDMPAEGFDVVVSQAAGSLWWLFDLAMPFVSKTGTIAALKGPSAAEEVNQVKEGAKKAGFRVVTRNTILPILGHKRRMVLFKRADDVRC